jgi:hypothetical protein
LDTVTYPQPFVQDVIASATVPVQINNSIPESKPLLERFRHIWTPDLRVLDDTGMELYRWNGFLPPAEFAPRLLAGLGFARLSLRQFEAAEAHYADVIRRFPTSFAAPEAAYYAAVTGYRKTGESNALLHGWHDLEKTYPLTEWTAKQNFD